MKQALIEIKVLSRLFLIGLCAATLLSCSPAPTVASGDGGARLRVYFSDAGPARLGIEIYRDATSDLPDVVPLSETGACRTGRTAGTVCAPNGRYIAGARVSAETRTCRGEPKVVETTADVRGYFVLPDLAPGPVNITITSGNFVGRFSVDIIAGQEVPVSNEGSAKVCLPADNARLAVLTGDYDDIGAVIDDLGFEHDVLCGSWINARPALGLLADFERLSQYAILFINCASGVNFRATNPEMDTIEDNIREYVRQGGSLYVSDLAVDWVQRLWPEKIQFLTSNPQDREVDQCCICTSDCDISCFVEPPDEPSYSCYLPNDLPQVCREPSGPTGFGRLGELTGDIVSPFLRQFVSEGQIPVAFDAGGWVEIESVAADVEVLVKTGDQPLMVLFEPYPGGGRVAYTSFHNHGQATQAMLEILRALIFRL